MVENNLLENLKKLRSTDQLKFVIKDDKDFLFAKKTLEQHLVPCPIIFQPVYGKDPKWLAEKVLRSDLKALGVRVMVQLHKVIWGEKRGV
jgi:7-carboxy-7-deazaguanine synthase